ncbi:hypothetical protein [Lactobacillus hominis]|uniref:SuB0782 undefined product 764400:764714 forward MW:11955 n=1 Tax=Lactobacillus hominis DSM 23910 = CRBIP 24.179 TaxID=1423758 RepID=I7L987_9LACO|nr:hypothetical protein [Lactobacillus hominis]MCT3347549.1 hypothetical protein [Lactobacillus hominis]CCI81209.1 Putative uncharacterized protein [Lactobacillus hominis DSM 23910 = CRBIP 24.179]
MKRRNLKAGYTKETAEAYLNLEAPIVLLSTSVEVQHVWSDGHRTDEISGYQAWFAQEGAGPFKVKFVNKPILPAYLSTVKFEKLEACEVRNNVYFRASKLKG